MEEERRLYAKWREEYYSRLPLYITQIDEALANQNYKKLSGILSEEDFLSHYMRTEEIASLVIAMGIYEAEIKDGIQYHIFVRTGSVKEIVSYLRAVKFAVWRLEFATEATAEEEFYDYKEQYEVSTWTVRYMIHASAMNKKAVLLKLAGIYERKGRVREQFCYLCDANTEAPQDEEVLWQMSLVYGLMKREDMELQCLKNIVNPSARIQNRIMELEMER